MVAMGDSVEKISLFHQMKDNPSNKELGPARHNFAKLIFFPNGFGASVISGKYSYGGPEGLYELAVLRGNENQ